MRNKLALVLLLVLIGYASPARADLLFSLNPAGLTGQSGDALLFNATLTNSGESEIFLNGDLAVIESGDLVIDDTLFFTNFPLSLQAGEEVTADLFQVLIGPAAQPGSYVGSFTFIGGLDANAQDDLATQNFLVTVTTSAPEPGSLMLLGIGIVVAMVALRRRRSGIQ